MVGREDRIRPADRNRERMIGDVGPAVAKVRCVLFARSVTDLVDSAVAAVADLKFHAAASAGYGLADPADHRRGGVDIGRCFRIAGRRVPRLVRGGDMDHKRPVFRKRKIGRKILPGSAVELIDVPFRCGAVARAQVRHGDGDGTVRPGVGGQRDRRGRIGRTRIDVGDRGVLNVGRLVRVILAVRRKAGVVFRNDKRIGGRSGDLRVVEIDTLKPAVAVRRRNGDRNRLIRPVRVVADAARGRG